MSGNHVSFEKMSDLYDGEIVSKEEQASLLRHIKSCDACSLEYGRLEKTITLCRGVAAMTASLEKLPPRTMNRIRWASRKRNFMKAMPAMAASIMVIAGVGLFNAGIISFSDRTTVADGSRRSYSESEQVIEIIRNHRATIAQVTDEFVEGTVPIGSFNELRKHLGARKVAYMLMEDAGQNNGASWGNPMEEVGLDDGQGVIEKNTASGKRYIRFRVFR